MCNIPGKVDRLNILKLDKNWRLVDEHDALLQWIDDSISCLVGAGNSRGARISNDVARHSDLSVDQGFHHLGHQLEGEAPHLLLQLSLVLLLQLLLRERQLKLRVLLLREGEDKVVVSSGPAGSEDQGWHRKTSGADICKVVGGAA